MARRCKTEEFSQIVDEARKSVPNINITTDIIVGFPGETEAEWQQSIDFIQQTGFGHIHIFTYSPREGTKAATLPDQLTQVVKKARSQQLHQLAATMKQAFFEQQLGQQAAVLWEGNIDTISDGSATVYGYTANYMRVSTVSQAAKALINTIQLTSLQQIATEGTHIESTVIER
jgi:threonylcarbamoyladenosine tRNA methylthiotransferase MtaB